jgi:hypothetical protein
MDFLKEVLPSASDRLLSADNIDQFIKDESNNAGSLFKAIQNLGRLESRISTWKQMELLELGDDPRFDYARIVADDNFDRLRRVLDEERPLTKINNFTDAASLCFLQQILSESIERRTSIPLLFVPSGIVRKAVASLRDHTFLAYEGRDGRPVSILRRADYYLLRASLWIPQRFRRDSKLANPMPELREMWKVVDTLISFAEQANLIGPESVIEIDNMLAEKIEQLRKLWFLDRTWIPFAIDKSTIEAAAPYLTVELKVLENVHNLAKSRAYAAAVRRDAKELHGKFDEGARSSTLLAKVWTRLHDAYDRFQNQFGYLGTAPTVSAASLFGLVKFGLTPDAEQILEGEFRGLLSPDDNGKRVLRQLIVRCRDSLKGGAVSHEEIANLSLTLWILEDYATLDELFGRLAGDVDNVPVWAQILHAASLLRTPHEIHRVQAIIGRLQRNLNVAGDVDEKVKLLIGIAYLNFHLWESREENLLWTVGFCRDGFNFRMDDPIDGNLQAAISSALRARNTARQGSGPYVYALNLYVYYMTEGAGDETFAGTEQYLIELLSYHDKNDLWQYRFSDTLARFYLRRAVPFRIDERSALLKLAMSHIVEAERLGRADRRVANFKELLKLIQEDAAKGSIFGKEP